MGILADLHLSPRTVDFLNARGHDAVRVNELLAPTASDEEIVAFAAKQGRVILTQDLDFSALLALRGKETPSLISLRLRSANVERVNSILEKVLPELESDVRSGSIVTVENERLRRRRLPIP